MGMINLRWKMAVRMENKGRKGVRALAARSRFGAFLMSSSLIRDTLGTLVDLDTKGEGSLISLL